MPGEERLSTKNPLARRFNLQVKMNPEKTRAEVILPGLSYDDFDRTGNVSLTKLLARISSTQMLFELGNEHSDFWMLINSSPALFFVRSMKYRINEELYSMKKHGPDHTFVCIWQAISTGISSRYLRYDLTLNGKEMVTLFGQDVYVSKETKRPTRLPEWYRNKVKTANGTAKRNMAQLIRPIQAFQYNMVVTPSDIDMYNHVTNSAYIRYCLDAGYQAGISGFYRNLPGDIAQYRCKEIEQLYDGESNLGEELCVYTWDTEEEKDTLYFQIANEKGRPIHHCILRFYQGRASSKL
ncbi:unnamed protein product [Owenia fusiformis]|uniref:Uncharacterized protein n=1 Tax=Owenia fusiformis TaxID=6347 RepID=A0A8J1U9K2_OWEFU|nr:unnamed protein product [Owenia fusiformis]